MNIKTKDALCMLFFFAVFQSVTYLGGLGAILGVARYQLIVNIQSYWIGFMVCVLTSLATAIVLTNKFTLSFKR